MADISQVKLPDNSVYNIKDDNALPLTGGQVTGPVSFGDSVSIDDLTAGNVIVTGAFNPIQGIAADKIIPIQSKTFTGVIGSGTANWTNGTFFFGSVRPTSFTDQWSIKYKVTAIAAGDARAKATSVFILNGFADTYGSYAAWNSIYNTSYRPCYYHVYYRLKEAGYNNGYGHALGVRLYSGWNAFTAANARTITIDILETVNCTFTFYDSMVIYTSIPGTGSTNYNTYTEFDFASNGLVETNDSNTLDNGNTYFSAKTGAKGIWGTSLFMEDGNGTYQNICTASDGTVTSNNRTVEATKIANTNGFKVGGNIFYTTTTYAANSNIYGYLNVYTCVGIFDSRYSLNTSLVANSLTPYSPVYLVGTIHSDGLFYLDSTWWTQTPTDTSKVYVLVGGCYDSTTSNCRILLYEHNPWYIYNGTTLEKLNSYWANLASSNSPQYGTAPEVASIKINGNTSAVAASTANVNLVYNSTTEALDFIFT